VLIDDDGDVGEVVYLRACRKKVLDKRSRVRVDDLIHRFAIETLSPTQTLGGVQMVHGVNYNCMSDDPDEVGGDANVTQTDTEIEMRVAVDEYEEAASEFRACGFVVSKSV